MVRRVAGGKADSFAALRNDKQKSNCKGRNKPKVLRLAALAQDDNFYFVYFRLLYFVYFVCWWSQKVKAATGAAFTSMLG